MSNLSNLRPKGGAVRKGKRLGRGDTTAGKGTKGQKSRSGGAKPRWFEGGQMPLYRRIPKRGFHNPFKKEFQLVNLDQLEKNFSAGENIDKERLREAGLIKKLHIPVKVLGRGEISKAFVLEVDSVSDSAKKKIEKAGGKVHLKSEKKRIG